MEQTYQDIGKQVYNLVDNDKDKIISFSSARSRIDDKSKKDELNHWFDMNVKEQDLNDLMSKGMNRKGLIDWISSEDGMNFFDNNLIKSDNVNNDVVKETPNKEKMISNIEDEDEDLYQIKPSKNCKEKDVLNMLANTNITKENKDDLDVAMDALDGSDEDIDITFDIVDMDGSEDIEVEIEDDSSDDEKESSNKKDKSHRTKIFLDHKVNKIVEKIDSDELIDRTTHEKYYVAKREHLKTPAELDKLEEELDKQLVSYYDFPSVAIKMYESNEVKLNRIFQKLGYEFRCKDIAMLTKNWHADEK